MVLLLPRLKRGVSAKQDYYERYKTLIDNLITKLTVELTKKYFVEK